MPGPITVYQTWKALWNESKPLRNWLWGKLPIVRDVKKREIVEAHLARLLDDASKLAQALPANVLDDKIAERVDQFRKEIAKEGITGDDANALVERASLLTRLYVTGPLGDVIELRFRLTDDEEALRAAEKSIEALGIQLEKLDARANRLEIRAQALTIACAICATAAVFGLLIALVALVSHR